MIISLPSLSVYTACASNRSTILSLSNFFSAQAKPDTRIPYPDWDLTSDLAGGWPCHVSGKPGNHFQFTRSRLRSRRRVAGSPSTSTHNPSAEPSAALNKHYNPRILVRIPHIRDAFCPQSLSLVGARHHIFANESGTNRMSTPRPRKAAEQNG